MNMTDHASKRTQQRVIPPLIVDWLIEYGAQRHDGHGATVYFFDRVARRNLKKSVGGIVVQKLSGLMNSYAVVADGTLITAGRRTKKISWS
jgi:hypothetical protein